MSAHFFTSGSKYECKLDHNKMVEPSFSQTKYSLRIAMYFVNNAKFCQATASSDTAGAF